MRSEGKSVINDGLAGGILIYDFKSFFDDAPHEPLLAEAERRLHDDRIRALHNSFIADFGPVYG